MMSSFTIFGSMMKESATYFMFVRKKICDGDRVNAATKCDNNFFWQWKE
jgi:hypothetical protein